MKTKKAQLSFLSSLHTLHIHTFTSLSLPSYMNFHEPDTTTTTTTAARRAAAVAMMRGQKAKYEDNDDDQEDTEEKKPRTSMAAGSGGGGRRISSGGGGSMSCCQADKCTVDLTEVKRYHRRHKVCEVHAKAPSVLVSGLPQRFCQQCSRFHEVAEFDDTKRSCRRRLAGHNERRRKSTSEHSGGSGSSSGRVKGPGTHCRPPDHERAGARPTQMASYGGNSCFKLR